MGGEGSEGGSGFGGGGLGGSGGNGGDDGGFGALGGAEGIGITSKLTSPYEPDAIVYLLDVHPGAAHMAPCQPSPYESTRESVHAPAGTVCSLL